MRPVRLRLCALALAGVASGLVGCGRDDSPPRPPSLIAPADTPAPSPSKASLSPETAAAEVLRYCAWPTQAASYLTGALEIARLEREWAAAGRGDLRAFHDTVAGTGRLPIRLVERCLR